MRANDADVVKDAETQLKLEILWCAKEIEALRTKKKCTPKQGMKYLISIHCNNLLHGGLLEMYFFKTD